MITRVCWFVGWFVRYARCDFSKTQVQLSWNLSQMYNICFKFHYLRGRGQRSRSNNSIENLWIVYSSSALVYDQFTSLAVQQILRYDIRQNSRWWPEVSLSECFVKIVSRPVTSKDRWRGLGVIFEKVVWLFRQKPCQWVAIEVPTEKAHF